MECGFPKVALKVYLYQVALFAYSRGYNFDFYKLKPLKEIHNASVSIPVTKGQVEFEVEHLHRKMKSRSQANFSKRISAQRIQLNPIFYLISGGIEKWEKI